MTIIERSLKNEERAILRLRQLYEQYGYLPYKMSKFEEYDLYVRNKSFLVNENILTFTDTDGKLMALKPDVTLSIVKNARSSRGALEKVYYNETVYRTSPASHGFREIMQAGLECIGDLDLYAMSEVVLLAARSLETVSPDYLLDLNHLGIVTGLLQAAGVAEEGRKALLAAIGEKNASAIAEQCARWGLAKDLHEQLCTLSLRYGGPEEMLPILQSLTLNDQARLALEELEAVCALLGPYSRRVRLDFSMVDDTSYYSGLIFRGFLPGLPRAVLSGGRYDHLLRRMGKDGGAIGFAVYLDLLERYGGQEETDCDIDVLLLYGESASAAAVTEAAESLIRSGRSVRVERTAPKGLRAREIREVR